MSLNKETKPTVVHGLESHEKKGLLLILRSGASPPDKA